MKIYALYVRYANGYTSVQTWESPLLRALEVILLSSQPVTLTLVDY